MDREPRDAPPLRLIIGLTVALVVLYQVGAALLISSLDSPRLAVGLAGPLFLLAPLVLALRGARLPVAASLRLDTTPPGVTAAAVFGIVAGVPAVLAVAGRWIEPSPSLLEFFDDLMRADSSAGLLAVLVAAALAPALSEELVFRGWLQRGLERRIGAPGAIVVTALAFGLIHGPARAPVATVLGALLGWVAWRAGSVGPAIAAHVAVNSVAVALANTGIGSAGPDLALSGAGADRVPWAVAAASAALSAAGLLVFARGCRRDRDESPYDPGVVPPASPS